MVFCLPKQFTCFSLLFPYLHSRLFSLLLFWFSSPSHQGRVRSGYVGLSGSTTTAPQTKSIYYYYLEQNPWKLWSYAKSKHCKPFKFSGKQKPNDGDVFGQISVGLNNIYSSQSLELHCHNMFYDMTVPESEAGGQTMTA